MKVLVLGAGVVGVTSAYFLAKAGHEVLVLDRQSAAAMETSFANGGQIAAAHAEPWANGSTLAKAFKWFGRQDSPLLFHWRFDRQLWSWAMRFLANCNEHSARVNTEKTLRVALYSRQILRQLRKETGLTYDAETRGILHFYRNEQEFEQAARVAETMRVYGLGRELKSPSQCIAIEPALTAIKDQMIGGLFSADDESGDAHLFTQRLAEKCRELGVTFKFNCEVERLVADQGRIVQVKTKDGFEKADAYLLAAGSYSVELAKALGIHLPIYPAKGYSATIKVANPQAAPFVSLTDDEHKLVFSRLGDRLRIAGTAEFAGYDTHLNQQRAAIVLEKAMQIFPNCGDPKSAQLWTGLRPKTPDSVPILGKSLLENLYLNTGHGTLGWTMSCGSAKILADIISSRAPDIDINGLGLERFTR